MKDIITLGIQNIIKKPCFKSVICNGCFSSFLSGLMSVSKYINDKICEYNCVWNWW